MEKFTNFLTVFVTVLLFFLWLLPAICIMQTTKIGETTSYFVTNPWGLLYIPIFIMTMTWGNILYRKYYS